MSKDVSPEMARRYKDRMATARPAVRAVLKALRQAGYWARMLEDDFQPEWSMKDRQAWAALHDDVAVWRGHLEFVGVKQTMQTVYPQDLVNMGSKPAWERKWAAGTPIPFMVYVDRTTTRMMAVDIQATREDWTVGPGPVLFRGHRPDACYWVTKDVLLPWEVFLERMGRPRGKPDAGARAYLKTLWAWQPGDGPLPRHPMPNPVLPKAVLQRLGVTLPEDFV